MRIVKNIFVLGFTLTMICLGFFLPEVVSLAQDESNLARVESYETNQVTLSLNPAIDLADTLQLLAQDVSLVKVREGKVMKPETVIQAAKEFQEHFVNQGFIELSPALFNEYDVQPAFARSSLGDEATVVIVWQCNVKMAEYPDSTLYMVIDDATGMVVECEVDTTTDAVGWLDESNLDSRVFIWADVWAEYLGYGYEILEDGERDVIITKNENENDSPKNEAPLEEGPVIYLPILLKDIGVRVVMECDIFASQGAEASSESEEELQETTPTSDESEDGEADAEPEGESEAESGVEEEISPNRIITTMRPTWY